MTQLFCRLYYLCVCSLVFENSWFFLQLHIPNPSYVAFARPLSWLPLNHEIVYPIVFFVTLATLISTFLYPVRALRIFSMFTIFLFFSMNFSFGKINHNIHIWIIAAIFFSLLKNQNPLKLTSNLFYVRLMQSFSLCPYFFSGLWKIRGPLFSQDLHLNAAEQITYALAEGNYIHPWLVNTLLYQYPKIGGYGLLLVVGFQLATIVPILQQKNFKFWGFMAVGFHITTGLTLGIWFIQTILGLLFLVVGTEFFLEAERNIEKQ